MTHITSTASSATFTAAHVMNTAYLLTQCVTVPKSTLTDI